MLIHGLAQFICKCPIGVLLLSGGVSLSMTLVALLNYPFPDFSDPSMGFTTRNTPISNRILAWKNLQDDTYSVSDEKHFYRAPKDALGKESNLSNGRFKRNSSEAGPENVSTSSKNPPKYCNMSPNSHFAQLVFEVNSHEPMETIIAMCQVEQRLWNQKLLSGKYCTKYETAQSKSKRGRKCCQPWHIGHPNPCPVNGNGSCSCLHDGIMASYPSGIPIGYAYDPKKSDRSSLPAYIQAKLAQTDLRRNLNYNMLLKKELDPIRLTCISHFCKCHKCSIDTLSHVREAFCCLEDPTIGAKVTTTNGCITDTTEFEEQCLSIPVLIASSRNYAMGRGHGNRFIEEFEEDNEDHKKELRFAAYRNFTFVVHGKLGFGRRCEIPCCVVHAIRLKLPMTNGQYVPYTPYIVTENELQE